MKKNAHKRKTPAPVASGGDDPNEKPYPGYARESADRQRRESSAAAAAADPLPGPLRAAFAGEPRVICGFTLEPVCAWLIAILKRIDSPILTALQIYRQHAGEFQAVAAMADDQVRAKAEVELHQKVQAAINEQCAPDMKVSIETAFCFVTPVETLQELLDAGRPAFTTAAFKKLGKLPAAHLSAIEVACGQHFADSFSTALSIVPAENPGGDKGFTPPPATRATASAGGSKSSGH